MAGILEWELVGIPEMSTPLANRLAAKISYLSREKDRRIAELEAELATAKQVIRSVSSVYWEWEVKGGYVYPPGEYYPKEDMYIDKIGGIVRSLK